MRSTASEAPLGWWKATERSRTSSSGWLTASIIAPSPKRLARIEGVAHGLADEDQERQHDGDGEEAGEAEPRRLNVGLALAQQFAERRRARRQAEAEKVQRRQRHHRRRQDERHESQRGDHRVRQQMAEDDGRAADAE